MRIKEFTRLYCQELLAELKRQKEMMGDDDLPYDEIIQDMDGNYVKVVYAGTVEIPIEDILGMEKPDFVNAYSAPEASDLYDRYTDSIIVLEGEEALHRIRNMIKAQQAQIEMFASLPEEFQ